MRPAGIPSPPDCSSSPTRTPALIPPGRSSLPTRRPPDAARPHLLAGRSTSPVLARTPAALARPPVARRRSASPAPGPPDAARPHPSGDRPMRPSLARPSPPVSRSPGA
ncbi:hypothetical protein GQ55_1G067300 [Panicum hallii var. hallii]|uniref:Uncharacterized protein n=1 Tax=Panicum hallii var. hallii TaxID=1504633 RepID=A0A2T7F2Z8_9POAL|nr:hypothetical protein GQ55_1G067300 [Panicum hallii var. hallii]